MQILENISLKEFNTFGVANSARFFVEIKEEADFLELIKTKIFKENKRLFLGGGSNVLFTKDFDGLLILNKIKGFEILEETLDTVLLSSCGGELWNDFVLFATERGLWGVENLALIPGTVGASPVQNIGAYGSEVRDTVHSVSGFFIENGEKKIFSNEECLFGYRDSIFKNELKDKFFITKVIFSLKKNGLPNLSYKPLKEYFEERGYVPQNSRDISDAVTEIRKSKLPDPRELGNAGSFFKNVFVSKEKLDSLLKEYENIPYFIEPASAQGDGEATGEKIKIPTGWLIEKAGFKGKRFGNVGVYEKQALVLVNFGGSTGEDVFNLAKEIQEVVLEKFDIEISPEINLI